MRSVIVVLCCWTLIFAASCNQYDSPVNAVPGTISGKVNVNDEDGNSLRDLSGVTISLDKTSISTQSNADGTWTLKDVPAGVYSISFSKPGYGLNKVISYNFAGNGDAYLSTTQISAIPELTSFVSSTSLDTSNEVRAILIEGAVSKVIDLTMNRTVILFLGRSEAVSSDPATYVGQSLAFVPGGTNKFTQIFSAQQLRSMGFDSGEKVFITSYAASKQYYRYVDVRNGRNFFCGISDKKQNFASFNVP